MTKQEIRELVRQAVHDALAEPSTKERLLTESELAEMTAITKRTWQHKRLHGDGPPFLKIGGAVRYRQSEVWAWLDREEHRFESTSEYDCA